MSGGKLVDPKDKLCERILRDFDRELPRFWQVVPKEMLDRLRAPQEALRA